MKTMKFVVFTLVLTTVGGIYAAETDVIAPVASTPVVTQVEQKDVVPVAPVASVTSEQAPVVEPKKEEAVKPVEATVVPVQAPEAPKVVDASAPTEPKIEKTAPVEAKGEPTDAELEKFFQMLAAEQEKSAATNKQ